MPSATRSPVTAWDIKQKAASLEVDLVGIADAASLNRTPPPGSPKKPSDISADDNRIIVLAKRYMSGTTRILDWEERHKHYNDEITLDLLEEAALRLVFWLEDQGCSASVLPQPNGNPMEIRKTGQHQSTQISLTHAAVNAGLGTLGLNLQLLTPEYGPRVILSGILCSVDCQTDTMLATALCHGPECGRCLSTCPGDVVGHWTRDWAECDRYRSPHGFAQMVDHFGNIVTSEEPEETLALAKSKESFHIWMSTLRGAGVTSGCRRCQDVCPVGGDYETMHADALNVIPEDTPEKQVRLAEMVESEKTGVMPAEYTAQKHWIGEVTEKTWE